MRLSTASLALGLLAVVSAAPAPISKRALSSNDTAVLQLALYLENLESTLYSQGCYSFTEEQYLAEGFPPGFRDNVCLIAEQELIHAATISSILLENGVTPVPNCTYQFPFSSPTTFVDLANMITSVGIGAYLGGAPLLMDNDVLLTSAAAILTNEARHDAYLRAGLGASPFPTPFDTPLSGVFAYNLAQQFVVFCPMQLPIIILPKLNLTSPMPPPNLRPPIPAGTPLMFVWDPSLFFVTVDPAAPLYIAMINQLLPPVFEQLTITGTGMGTVPVPEGVGNVVFAVLTTFSGGLDQNQLTSFGTLSGPAEVVIS